MREYKFYKKKDTDTIWWVDSDAIGEELFSFDKRTVYNLFDSDDTDKLTDEQRKLFMSENPGFFGMYVYRPGLEVNETDDDSEYDIE